MKIAIISVNDDGGRIAQRLKGDFPEAAVFSGRMDHGGALAALAGRVWGEYEGLVFICALGITVRVIAGLVKSKHSDPAVVSVDTAGRFAVSVLSGHEGGANKLAYAVAASVGAVPVITTGTEARKKIVVGIGMRRGIRAQNVKEALEKAMRESGIALGEIRCVATVDLKKNEAGLLKTCDNLGLPLIFIPQEAIARFKGAPSVSGAARRHLGLDGVCEPCALLAGRRAALILEKTIVDGVTVALVRED